ncbi:YchJ family protein [Flavobacterium sp. RSP29]|uniref:YchJ family protein n=1 Tax=Flavobacterium sp. RSP29 TaxID=3401731 RepID=UPI003AAA7D9E
MTKIKCHCGFQKNFDDCCEPFINGTKKPATALELMRSRFSAYVIHSAEYLLVTTHLSERKYYLKSEILHWATSNQWLRLEIIKATENTVEFKAYFLDNKLQKQIHHEFSTFKLENGSWFYVDGKFFN